MSLLIAHVESERAAEWKGYLYAVGLLAVLVIQSLANAYSSQMMYILGMNVKTAVTAAVYRDGLLSSRGKRTSLAIFVVVAQLIHRLAQADISCTTTARLFFIPPLVYYDYNTICQIKVH